MQKYLEAFAIMRNLAVPKLIPEKSLNSDNQVQDLSSMFKQTIIYETVNSEKKLYGKNVRVSMTNRLDKIKGTQR